MIKYKDVFVDEKKYCDRCGFTYYKCELIHIGGKYLCKECLDDDE